MLVRAVGLVLIALMALAPPSAVGQSEQIQVGVGPVDAAAAVFYADKTGLFAKHGLNVQLVKLPNGAAILSAIAGGSLQLGQGSALALIQGFVKGLPFEAIGGNSVFDAGRPPDYGLLVPADSTIKAPKDLEGRNFGVVALQDQNSLATDAWLDAHGVDRAKLKIVEMPASAMLAAFEQGRIDAATFYEPFYSSFMASGKLRSLGDPYEAIGKHYDDALLYGNKSWVDAHRDLVVKFLEAMREASEYVGAHEADVVPITAEYTGAKASTLASMHHGVRTAALTAGDLQPMIDMAAKFKFIDKAFPASDMICSCALRR